MTAGRGTRERRTGINGGKTASVDKEVRLERPFGPFGQRGDERNPCGPVKVAADKVAWKQGKVGPGGKRSDVPLSFGPIELGRNMRTLVGPPRW